MILVFTALQIKLSPLTLIYLYCTDTQLAMDLIYCSETQA